MKEWWHRKRERTRRRKGNNSYTLLDLGFDVLFWIPELILLPFRIIFWLVRGLGRLIADMFDNT